MDVSLGRIQARLAEPKIERISELVGLINDNINPPSKVTETDVYIRAMYIVSDEVNSFGGRFPSDELSRLTDLLVDSPVMVGHRKDRLPVARTFHAHTVERDGRNWVKSYFYWLRSARGADDLKENIDGGIYKECSIGFTYLFPECSICGKDIRTCRHEPSEKYVNDGETHTCHFNYRQVERVLETSLVYRGAVRDTAMSKELATGINGQDNDCQQSPVEPKVISSPAELPLDDTYLVVPVYESIPVLVNLENGQASLMDLDGNAIKCPSLENLKLPDEATLENAYGQLVGFRGKERCDEDQLKKYLDGFNSAVTRIELKIFPAEGVDPDGIEAEAAGVRMGVIRHAFCTVAELEKCAGRLKTRHGVRLWSSSAPLHKQAGYLYRPEKEASSDGGFYRFCMPSAGQDVRLEFCFEGAVGCFSLKQFNLRRFMRGSRFIADQTTTPEAGCERPETVVAGAVRNVESVDDSLLLRLEGAMTGLVIVQPLTINGSERYMVYRPAEE